MDFELDCESGVSTLGSLCQVFSCSAKDLEDVLLSIDIDSVYEQHSETIDVPAEKYLYHYVVENLKEHKPLMSVCWFHLTRTKKRNEFKNGILPLGQSLDSVWSMLIDVAKDKIIRQNLSDMRESGGVDNWLYNLKAPDPFHWGPYAILVKDVASHAKRLGQHDYLGMPEIVEDICNGYQQKYGVPILHLYEKNLIPKIIKFRSSARVDCRCLEAAISYAYTYVRSLPPCRGAVTCFDGKGVRVPAQDILAIDFIVN